MCTTLEAKFKTTDQAALYHRPHAFASGGIIPGILTVLWCGLTAWLGLYFLSRCAAKAPHRAASFAALSNLTFPRIGRKYTLHSLDGPRVLIIL